MIPRRGYRFLEKIMLKPVTWSEMMARRAIISLEGRKEWPNGRFGRIFQLLVAFRRLASQASHATYRHTSFAMLDGRLPAGR
jgi:hypothetical protein